MQLELKRIQHEVGITFIYVTHDQDEAMTMSDRIAVMRSGRIEQVGGPEEVYERPATEFVAGFLGASNLLSGTIEAREGAHAVLVLASGEKVRVPSDRVGPDLREARLGVRPERIRISAREAAPPEGRNAIQGRLLVSTYVGVSNVYTVEAPTGEHLTVYAQNVESPEDRVPAAGEDVVLSWHPQHTFVVEPG